MRKLVLILAVVALAFVGTAQAWPPPWWDDGSGGGGGGGVPEIDPTMAIGGVAALAGGLMVLRHYRRRK